MNEVFLSKLTIAPSRRLVSDAVSSAVGISEYFSPVLETRIIEIPPSMFLLHTALEACGISVPTTIEKTKESIKLQIPSGTQTVQQVLKSIATDTVRYAPLFEGIGIQLNRAQKAGYGFMQTSKERSFLGSIAFSPVERGDVEDSVFFLPPYALGQGESILESSHKISIELMESGHFNAANARDLMFALLLGIGKDKDER